MKTTTRVLVRVAACAVLAVAATPLWPASARAQGGAPKYEVDTSWPQPWPERWVIGPIGTACVDSKDHVLLLNRQDLVDTDLDTGTKAPAGIDPGPAGRAGNARHEAVLA